MKCYRKKKNKLFQDQRNLETKHKLILNFNYLQTLYVVFIWFLYLKKDYAIISSINRFSKNKKDYIIF